MKINRSIFDRVLAFKMTTHKAKLVVSPVRHSLLTNSWSGPSSKSGSNLRKESVMRKVPKPSKLKPSNGHRGRQMYHNYCKYRNSDLLNLIVKRGEKFKGAYQSRALKLSSMRVIQANVGVDKRGKIYTWVYTKLHRSANSNFEE
jgi:hypothetical protein